MRGPFREGLHEVSARGLDLFRAQRDIQNAFEQVQAFFLAVVDVQGWPASGRYDRFHDEIPTVGLGASDQKSVSIAGSTVTGTGSGR